MKEKHKTDAEEILNFRNIANMRTQADYDAYRKPRLAAAEASAEDAKYFARREKRYERMWRWMGRVAHFGFLVGLISLLAFAVSNM